MGGSSSKQSASSITAALSSVMQSNHQDCQTKAKISQFQNLSGLSIGNRQTMITQFSKDCLEENVNSAELAAKIVSALAQSSDQDSVAGIGWTDAHKTTQSASIESRASSAVDTKNMQQCAVNLNAKQVQSLAGINLFNTQYVSFKNLAQCTMNNKNSASIRTDIANTLSQHSKQKSENPLQPFADMAESATKGVVMIIAIVLVVGLIMFAVMFAPGGAAAPAAKSDSPYAALAAAGVSALTR